MRRQRPDARTLFCVVRVVRDGSLSSLPTRRRACDEIVSGACLLVGTRLAAADARIFASRYRLRPRRSSARSLSPPHTESRTTPRRQRRLAAVGVARCCTRQTAPAALQPRWRDAAADAPTLVVRMACCHVWRLLPRKLHDSSDIVVACVRSHESLIEYIRFIVRI